MLVSIFLFVALLATKSGAMEFVQSNSLPDTRNYASDGWSNFRPHISSLQQEAYETFQSFRIGNPLEKGIDMSNIRNAIVSSTKPVVDQLERIRCHLSCRHKGAPEFLTFEFMSLSFTRMVMSHIFLVESILHFLQICRRLFHV